MSTKLGLFESPLTDTGTPEKQRSLDLVCHLGLHAKSRILIRSGMPSGHIPTSLPLPFSAYLEPSNDKRPYSSLKPTDQLRNTLVDAVGGESKWKELDQQPLVFTCGSGMTAAVGWLADTLVREEEGKPVRGALYDEVSSS